MKRICLFLLAVTLVLPAVNWHIVSIDKTEDKHYSVHMLALDGNGNPRILFLQSDTTLGVFNGELRVASNASGSWVEKVVSVDNDSFSAGSERLVVDSKGNTYVGFVSAYDCRVADIWLACDSSGEFELTKLLEDDDIFFDMDMAIDNEDNIHIVYRKSYGHPKTGFTYVYVDQNGISTEVITDTMSIDILFYFELVVDNDNIPHLFWTGSDTTLYHASQSSIMPAGWKIEQISESSVGYLGAVNISAAVDDSNFLHLACRTREGTRYLSNRSGKWEEEMISDDPDDYWPVIAVYEDENVHLMCHAPGSAYWSYYTNSKIGWDSKEQVVSGGAFPDGDFFRVDALGYGHFTFYNIYPDLTGDVFYGRSITPLIAIKEASIETPNELEIRNGEICFGISHSSQVTLNLYDAAGRMVQRIASGYYPAGEYAVPINVSELSSGVYFVMMKAGRRSVSAKFVVTY